MDVGFDGCTLCDTVSEILIARMRAEILVLS